MRSGQSPHRLTADTINTASSSAFSCSVRTSTQRYPGCSEVSEHLSLLLIFDQANSEDCSAALCRHCSPLRGCVAVEGLRWPRWSSDLPRYSCHPVSESRCKRRSGRAPEPAGGPGYLRRHRSLLQARTGRCICKDCTHVYFRRRPRIIRCLHCMVPGRRANCAMGPWPSRDDSGRLCNPAASTLAPSLYQRAATHGEELLRVKKPTWDTPRQWLP